MKFSRPDWPWTTTIPGTGPPDSGKLAYSGMLLPSTFKVSHELVIFHLLRTYRLCCPFPKLSKSQQHGQAQKTAASDTPKRYAFFTSLVINTSGQGLRPA